MSGDGRSRPGGSDDARLRAQARGPEKTSTCQGVGPPEAESNRGPRWIFVELDPRRVRPCRFRSTRRPSGRDPSAIGERSVKISGSLLNCWGRRLLLAAAWG